MEATTSMNRDAYRPSNARENLVERVEYEERESRVKTEPMSQDDQAMAALNEHEKLRKCRKLLHRIEGVQNFGNFQYSQDNLRYVGLIRDRYEDQDRVKNVYDKEVDYLKTAVKEKFEEQIQKLKLMRDLEIKKLDQKKDLALTQLLHSSGPLEAFHALDEVLNQQKELCEDAERDPLKLDELMGKYHSMKKVEKSIEIESQEIAFSRSMRVEQNTWRALACCSESSRKWRKQKWFSRTKSLSTRKTLFSS